MKNVEFLEKNAEFLEKCKNAKPINEWEYEFYSAIFIPACDYVEAFYTFLDNREEEISYLLDQNVYINILESLITEPYSAYLTTISSYCILILCIFHAIIYIITILLTGLKILILYPFFSVYMYLDEYIDLVYSVITMFNQKQNLFLINSSFFFFFGILFLLSTIFSFFFVSYLGLYGVFIFNIIPLFFFWITSFTLFIQILDTNQILYINFGKWFYIFNNYCVNFDFYVDHLAITYSLLTLTISFFVQLYTFAYFRYEPLVERLILFLNTFILSMLFFVNSANIVLLFFSWECIGLTSFILINFWVTRKATLKAAFKAFVFNKISDIFFFLFLFFCIFIFNTTNILIINTELITLQQYSINILNIKISAVELITFCLIIAAFIKSAQLGFHLWLPDSMEAPVPASALIHSATLVSAGLFLLLRFNLFFELSNYCVFLIPLIGSLTSFYGGLSAMFQSDVKRILAYSTISHCGFLVTTCFFFNSEVTLFYLYVHGFFKAGVFLCIGNIIRFNQNYQDFRKMGLMSKYLLNDCYFLIFGLFNLGGLPFSLGFYMKHYFLTLIEQNSIFNSLIFVFCICGSLTGIFYSYKLIDYVFFDYKKAKKHMYLKSTSYSFQKKINNYFIIISTNFIKKKFLIFLKSKNISEIKEFIKKKINSFLKEKNSFNENISFIKHITTIYIEKFCQKINKNSFNYLWIKKKLNNVYTIYIYRNNSTLGTLAIKYLFIFAYIICFIYLYFYWTSFNVIENFFYKNSSVNNLFLNNLIFFWNFSFINWFILFLLIVVFFSYWRFTINYTNIFNKIFILILIAGLTFIFL